MAGGTEMTVQELLEEYDKKAPFYKTGGITATGGEPMVQIDFLTELFTALTIEVLILVWIHQV